MHVVRAVGCCCSLKTEAGVIVDGGGGVGETVRVLRQRGCSVHDIGVDVRVSNAIWPGHRHPLTFVLHPSVLKPYL